MIERTEFDGRPATICYVDDDFVPCPIDQATMLRVLFDDGDTMWLMRVPGNDDEPDTPEESDADILR